MPPDEIAAPNPNDRPEARGGFGPMDLTLGPAEETWVARELTAMATAWDRGESMTARDVLERHPTTETETAVRIIYEEVCLRQEAGEQVDISAVVHQYPQWENDLRLLLECDRLLGPPGLTPTLPEPGESLGPFRLISELGRGASGRTFLATDLTLADRTVVLKVVADDQDEHLALARLRHTHIVPLFSEHTFPERGLRALCMPYLGGASLDRILHDLSGIPPAQRSGKLLTEIIDRNTPPAPTPSPEQSPFRRGLEQASYVQAVTWIISCLADALQYAHARGLVHMDLKPSNVLITVDGQPILLDFHLARGPVRPGDRIVDRLGGTPGWMSPEQDAAMKAILDGKPIPTAIDGRSDLFSLGLVLAEVLALPARSENGQGARDSIPRETGVSVGLADIVRKCLAPDPGDRYSNAATLGEDLRRHLNDLPLRGVRNRSPLELWGKWRRRRPSALAWGVTAISLVLALIVILAASWAAHRQQVSQLQIALDDGRRDRIEGKYDDAIRTLKRGLESTSATPVPGELMRSLAEELRLAQWGRMADELHDLADLIRFQYGADLPSPEDARAILKSCQAVWERRQFLIPASAAAVDPGAMQKIRTDLLELAAIWADLRIRLAAPAESRSSERDVLSLLDEAEALLGPSLAIESRREQILAGSNGIASPVRSAPSPHSAWEHYDLGRYHLRSGRIEAADAEFRLALGLRPQDFWANFYQGLCSFRLHHFEDATSAFRACIAIRPQAAVCYHDRAMCHEGLGKDDEACRDYTRAIELDPDFAAARLNRGILSHREGRDRDAIADYEQALHGRVDRETLGLLHYNLAVSQLAVGDRRAALTSAEAAIRYGCTEARSLRIEPH